LAENLHRAGLTVFFDEWEIGGGDVLVERLQAGLRTARTGILVLSRTSVARPWVQEEYAALMTGAVAGRQRLIPVLLDDVELPPFVASRIHVDFGSTDNPEYERRFNELVQAVRGERGRPPDRRLSLNRRSGNGSACQGR
jgi:TIR domain